MSRFVLDFAEGAADKIALLTERRPLIGAAIVEALAELAALEIVEPQEMSTEQADELAFAIQTIPQMPPEMPATLAQVMTIDDEIAAAMTPVQARLQTGAEQETEPVVTPIEQVSTPLTVEQEQALNNEPYNGTAESSTENEIDITAFDDLDLDSLDLPDFSGIDVDDLDIEGIDLSQFDDLNTEEDD